MKKKLVILGLLAVLLSVFALSVQAGMLSPAIGVMQKECGMIKTGVGSNTVSFSKEDFKTVFGESEPLGIVITELPALSDGVLKLGVLDVYEGQIIAGNALGALRFVPASAGKTATFGFLPYGESYAEDFVCTVYMLDALNFAPTAKADTLSALEEVPVYASLSAEDPDGDAVTFLLEKAPENGTLTLNTDGTYCYTAQEGAAGEDRFSYVAVDPYGNRSAPYEVVITTEKNTRGIVYHDLFAAKEAHAAVLLAENDAFIGEKIGSAWYFHPEKTVTRGEFLIMAMKMNDMDPALFAARDSAFADKESFSETEERYIAAARALGIVQGMDTEEGRCFKQDEPITSAQASTIISRIAGLYGVDLGDAVPVSAEAEVSDEGMALLASVGLAAGEGRDTQITRADAAGLLYQLSLKTGEN